MKTPISFLLALSAFGCAQQMDSEDVRTSGIRAEFEVVAFRGDSNDPTQARAILYGGSDPLRLTGQDRLEVFQVGGGDPKTMTRRSGAHDYLAYFGEERSGGTEFVFAFVRGPDDTDAPDTRVTLPPAFEIQGLESNGEVSRSSNLVLTWEGEHTDDQVNYEIIGGSQTCLRRRAGNVASNTGTLVIPASDFVLSAGNDATEFCGARLFVELERVGTRDEAFKEATIRGKQRYWIQFVSTP